jgi:hypothetical protein
MARGLSKSAIRARVHRLQKKGYINIRVLHASNGEVAILTNRDRCEKYITTLGSYERARYGA